MFQLLAKVIFRVGTSQAPTEIGEKRPYKLNEHCFTLRDRMPTSDLVLNLAELRSILPKTIYSKR
jgi:hypothetical protein